MTDSDDELARLRAKLAAKDRTIAVLMKRLEAQHGQAGNGALSQTIALEQTVGRKTNELQAQRDALREALDELQRTQTQLLQAQKLEAIGRLAAGVAHEINTPIQFVNDSVHFIRDALGDLDGLVTTYRGAIASEAKDAVAEREDEVDIEFLRAELPKAATRAIEGLERVATLVRAMKEFAHPDQKEMSAVDLNSAVRSTLAVARNEYKYVAEVEVELGELPPVRCHAGELNQVVLNLLVNAAHAIEDRVRGTDAKGTIYVRTRADGAFVEIAVEDTGSGIPESIRERIFDPFFTTKGVGKGTGQGLAIARSVVVEKHAGTIRVDSVDGAGTTFTLRIPHDPRRNEDAA